MITNLLIELVTAILAPAINAVLPHLSLGSVPTVIPTVLTRVGAFLRFFTPIVPVGIILAWLEIWAGVLLAGAGYTAFQWVWGHLPIIAGFGPGGGGG